MWMTQCIGDLEMLNVNDSVYRGLEMLNVNDSVYRGPGNVKCE